MQFILKMYAAAQNHEKFTKTHNFDGIRSFKVIGVDNTKKPVTSACHYKQHVRFYRSATVFILGKPIAAN